MGGFEITSEVTTKSTGGDGTRDSQWSGWDKNTAPEDYVINRDTVKVEWLGQNGSENSFEIVYEDWVPINPNIPDLKFPQTIKVRTYARSPKGYFTGRGWSKIKVTGEYVKYK